MASHTQELVDIKAYRTEEDLFIIHLYQEGIWFRAYNYSAYLLDRLINLDKMVSTPVKRMEKTLKEPIVFIALNNYMFPKLFPDINVDDFIDKHYELDVRDLLVTCNHISVENYRKIYNEWLDSLRMYDSFSGNPKNFKKNIEKQECISKGETILTSRDDKVKQLLKDILHYRIDKNTPLNWGGFIENLQHQVIDIIDS